MGVLVVGSVALDSVQTPFGAVRDALGGSGTFFSVAASYFTDVALVAVAMVAGSWVKLGAPEVD